MRGYRPVCEIQFDGFVYPAFDQIVSQLAKMHHRSSGNVRLPVTIRIPFGGGIGAVEHHSESPEAYFAHTAGLKVVACSNPVDAYFMIQQSIACDDPVIFLEPKRRYWEKAEVDTGITPDPLHSARVVRTGSELTIAAYGPMVKVALDAATAAEDDGAARGHRPALAVPARLRHGRPSVRRTGRLVVVHEAPVTLGSAPSSPRRVTEQAFYALEAPVLRVGGFDTPYPPSRLEEDFLPDLDRVLDAVDRSMAF
jgi:pyruvate dehydrogenase E1 component beta subunit